MTTSIVAESQRVRQKVARNILFAKHFYEKGKKKVISSGMKALSVRPVVDSQINRFIKLKAVTETSQEELSKLKEKNLHKLKDAKDSWDKYWSKNQEHFELTGYAHAKTFEEPTKLDWVISLLFLAEACLAFYLAYNYFSGGVHTFDAQAVVKAIVCAGLVETC